MNGQGNIPNNNGMGEINNQNMMNNQNTSMVGNNMPNITLGQVVNNEPMPMNNVPPANNMVQNGSMPQMVNQAPPVNQMPVANGGQLPPNNSLSPQDVSQPAAVNPPQSDDIFTEPKQKPWALIIIIILLLLVVGGGLLYYFVLDNPKTIFTTVANSFLDKTDVEEIKNKPVNYTLGVDIISEDEDIKELAEIINQIKLEGTTGLQANMTILNGVINYKNEKMLDYNLQIDSDNNVMYAKFADLYENVLKIDLSTNETVTSSNVDVDKKDYEQVMSSLKTAIASSLESANYKKEITKLNNQNVKMVTLVIDKTLITGVYNKLLQDSKFMESYAKITSMTQEEITDDFNKEIADVKDIEGSISLYLTLLKNEFLKLTYSYDKDSLTISKEDNTLNFNISESSVTKYDGSIKINDVSGKKIVMAKVTSTDDNLTVNINATYSTVSDIALLDTTNAVSYDELSEEDMMEIILKAAKNEALMELLEDLGLTDGTSLMSSSDI